MVGTQTYPLFQYFYILRIGEIMKKKGVIGLYENMQRGLHGIITIILGLMMIVILAQTITRYVFFYSLPWSEELSRYLFVWMIMLGVNIGIRDNMQVKIDIIDRMFTGNVQKIISVVQYLISLFVSGMFFYSTLQLMEIGARQLSPALQLPMNLVYMCLPIGLGIAVLEIVRKIFQAIKGKEENID